MRGVAESGIATVATNLCDSTPPTVLGCAGLHRWARREEAAHAPCQPGGYGQPMPEGALACPLSVLGGRLYVLGFQGLRAVVKVGSTGAPERQFDKYETQARNLGYALVDGWVSAPVGARSEAYRMESMILTNLHHVLNGHIDGGRIFEWFHDHDFERIRQLVEDPTALFHLTLERALAR